MAKMKVPGGHMVGILPEEPKSKKPKADKEPVQSK